MKNRLSQRIHLFILAILAVSSTITINLFSNHLSSICTYEKTNSLNIYCLITELKTTWSLVVLLIIVISFFVHQLWSNYISKIFLPSDTTNSDKKQRPLEIGTVPVPIDSKKFQGRDQDLKKLHKGLEKNKIFAILGMSGVGKSELAKQYAHNDKYKKKYEDIFWISSELANKPTVKRYFSHLQKTTKPILVIFHDCYDFEKLQDDLPSQDYIKVLITSPLAKAGSYVNASFTLEPLSEKAAIDFFKSHPEHILPAEVDREIDSVKGLCKELRYLPIALKAASDYIKHPREFRRLRYLLQADSGRFFDKEDLLALGINQNSDLQIEELIDNNTLKIYAELWDSLSEAEKRLAYCISFFAPAQVPGFLIDEFGEIISNSINTSYPQSIQYGYNRLWSIYLSTPPDKENQFVKDLKQKITIVPLHPIVRIFFNRKRKELVNQLESLEREFCRIMAKIARDLPQDANRNGIPLMEDLIAPHLEAAVTLILNNPTSATWFDETQNGDEPLTLLDPFMGLVKFYIRIGQSAEAIKWQKICKEFLINNRGCQDPLYTRCLNNLACLYKEEEYYHTALESARQNLEANHELTALIHRNFGIFYRDIQPDYQRATEQFQAAIRIYDSSEELYREKILTQCHLAQVQCYLDFEAAEIFYSSSELESFRKELKSSDSKKNQIDYSEIEYELAEFYRLQAKSNYDQLSTKGLSKAAHHSREALEIREKYQKEEISVAHSHVQLARIYEMRSKFCIAEGYYARALQIYQADPQTSDELRSRVTGEYNQLFKKHRYLYFFRFVRWLGNKVKSSSLLTRCLLKDYYC